MKQFLLILLLSMCLFSCGTRKPLGFTNYFTDEYTGIDTLININGYFLVEEKCENDFYNVFMFYPNGLFTQASANIVDSDFITCFTQEVGSNICKYPSWGTYEINNDTIKTQLIVDHGLISWGKVMEFRDYLILPSKELLYISYYCIDKNIKGCNQNPENPCPKIAQLIPLSSKRSIKDCPWINKRWFNKANEKKIISYLHPNLIKTRRYVSVFIDNN